MTPILALSGAVLLWGTSFAATKVALSAFAPLAVIWLRMLLATFVFAPLWTRIPRPEVRTGDWRLLLVATLCIPCLYYLFEGYSVQYTTSGQAGVISAILPLLVGAGAWVWLGERLTSGWGAAIVASLVGVALLSTGGAPDESAPNPVLGNLLELGAMVAAAGSMVIVKRLSVRYSTWFLTGLQAVVGAIFFAPPALSGGTTDWLSAPPIAWVCVGYLAIGVSLGAFGLYNLALSRLPASRASLAINLVPVVALATGWWVRAEALTWLQLAGATLIIGAVVVTELVQQRGSGSR